MWTTLIIFFFVSIIFSFLCSIWEAVLLSITPSFITSEVQKGSGMGKTLQAFKEDIDKPLSAILTLNTIAHTVGAIGVGSEAAKLFKDSTFDLGYGLNMEAIVAIVMTLAILILSEIIPKTLGANYWRRFAPFTVSSLKFLLFILAPLVWVSQLITKNLKKNKEQSVFSRADFSAMTQAGEESGALKVQESRTIKNLLKLDQIQVQSIMTPRSVMLSTTEDKTLQEFYDQMMPLRHSRIPIFDKDKEAIKGILLKNDLFEAIIENKESTTIGALLRPAIYISNKASLSELQDILMKDQSHVAIVNDEFGAILGLVTWEDLLETILGLEIIDETDDAEDLQKVARDLWEKRRKDLSNNA